MIDASRGEIGYHELAKIMASKGYSTVKPDIDQGVDMLAVKDNEIALIQIKTVIYTDGNTKKNITASGSKNGRLDVRYEGLNLVVLCMDKKLQRLYSLVFSPENIPSVQCLWVPKDYEQLDKYSEYKSNFKDLKFSSFGGSNMALTDF